MAAPNDALEWMKYCFSSSVVSMARCRVYMADGRCLARPWLQVGGSKVDLSCRRYAENVGVEVVHCEGPRIDVEIFV